MRKLFTIVLGVAILFGLAPSAQAATTKVVNKTNTVMSLCIGTYSSTGCSKTYSLANGKTYTGAVSGVAVPSRYAYARNGGGWWWGPNTIKFTGGTQTFTGKVSAAQRILGTPKSGNYMWHSGVWVGDPHGVGEVTKFENKRGRKADIVLNYSGRTTWAEMTNNWYLDLYKDHPGRTLLGITPIPDSAYPNTNPPTTANIAQRRAVMRDIAAGKYDSVYRTMAQRLVATKQEDTILRVAWEYGYMGWRHGIDQSLVPDYINMWRRVVTVMRSVPGNKFKTSFEALCGGTIRGATNGRLSAFNAYPGDAYVDLVGCSTYDWYHTSTKNYGVSALMNPPQGVGIQDIANFARTRGKGMIIGEWGLCTTGGPQNGSGDYPVYIKTMYDFMVKNRDVLAGEVYFDDTLHSLSQFPSSQSEYNRHW